MRPQNVDLASAATEAALAVREFLLRHGGMENGYLTWAQDSEGQLTWHTPRSDDMTANELRAARAATRKELLPVLGAVIKRHGIGIELEMKREHVEYGCYRTTVTASLKCSVNVI